MEASLTQNPDLMAYQFQLACTILRLIGQIFCVFLKNHMNVLPPIKSMIDNTTIDLNLKLDPVTEKIGVIFESMMFGSQIDWLRDPTRADNCNQVRFIPLTALRKLKLTFSRSPGNRTLPTKIRVLVGHARVGHRWTWGISKGC